jgi:serine/threonine-protein kinase
VKFEADGSPRARLTRKNGMRRAAGDEMYEREPMTCRRPLPRPVRVGDVVAGKYRLADTLGSGGMGRVYAAYHLMLDTKVALKFMHPHLLRDPLAVARFAREARAAATLKSAHAARVIDVDQLPSGELFIVMEYLHGHSLESVAASRRGLPIAEAVAYVLQACDALAEAHAQGIVHRDVKPANLFLVRGGSAGPMIKVLDFGLAQSIDPGVGVSAAVAAAAEVFGTPQYMSPEQIRGARDVDARTDVWSIGVTLYELLAGRAAFDGHCASVVFDRVLAGAFTPLRALRPEVSPALSAIVQRCLARDPRARFASVRELAQAVSAASASASTAPPRFAGVPAASVGAARYVATMPSASGALAASERSAARTHRSTWSSYPPPAVSVSNVSSVSTGAGLSMVSTAGPASSAPRSGPSGEAGAPGGPTLAQTILAALAGPALIAVAAAAFVLSVGTADLPALHDAAHAASARRTTATVKLPAGAVVITAKSARLPARARATASRTRS